MKKVIMFLICLYIFVLPIFPSKYKYKGIPFNGDVILAIIILCYFVFILFNRYSRKRLISGIKDFLKNYINIFMVLWLVMMFISIIYATDKILALQESIRFSTYIIFFFLIKYEMNSKYVLDKIMISIIISSSIVGIIGIFEYFKGIGINSMNGFNTVLRVSSTLENSNNLGAFFILITFPIFMLLLREKYKMKRLLYVILLIISVSNVIISFSRNALIGLIIGCICLIIIYNYKMIYVTIIGLSILCFTPKVFVRIQQIFDKSQNLSRISLWEIAISMIRDYPILGVGNGNYRSLYMKYYKKIKYLGYTAHANFHPHNIFLKVQCELGIIGSTALIGFFLSLINGIRKFSKRVKNSFYSTFYKGFLASIISFIFMNVIDNFFSAPKVIGFFWIIVAVYSSYEYNIGC